MTLLTVHFVLLTWISHRIARRLVPDLIDRIVATAMLYWGNIVLLCLLLAQIGKLGDEAWFFRGSLLLGLATLGLARRLIPSIPAPPALAAVPGDKRSTLLILTVFGTLGLMLLANLRMAAAYPPNNYDSLCYHLPRVLYYLGHNSLAHFETADIRQVYFPFNFNLLQLACFIYSPPPQVINFLNVIVWMVAGLGVYRVSRLCGNSFNSSLAATWLALTATEVLAQATSTTLDLPTSAALLSAVMFALRWRQSPRVADALLAGLGAGLAAGTKLTVVFFGPTVVLLLLTFWYQHWRRAETRVFFSETRAWTGPAVLALFLSVPFIIYNLAATGRWMTNQLDFTLNKPFSFACVWQTAKTYLFQLFFEPVGRFSYDLPLIGRLNAWFHQTFFSGWNPAHAYSDFYIIPPDLNEDHVWYGFAGPLFLGCALICLWRDRRLRGPIGWLALLGLGWFATYFAMNKWSLYIQRYFLPTLMLMGPCAAAVWDSNRSGTGLRTRINRCAFYLVAATSLWFSVVYLAENRNRPFSFPYTEFTPPVILPDVPPLLRERLAGQSRINIISDGTNERIYLLMNLGRHQRFTSSQQVDPGKYNVLSFWGFTRNNIYSNIAHIASHTMVAIPDKRTAGVEFLGTVGTGVNAFDYVGLVPHANETKAGAGNKNIAVLVRYRPSEPDRFMACSLRVTGLNPADDARVEINAEMTDGTTVPLMAQDHSGEIKFGLAKPFKRLSIQVVDRATGRKIGYGDLPYTTKPSEADIEPPLSATTLFSSELITTRPVRNLSVNGLADPEGPYAKWDLPLFRWAKQPTVRIEVPANPRLTRLRLSFDVRLQIRDEGRLSVLHNGRFVQAFPLRGRTDWLHAVLEFTPTPGENVIELRDDPETPDWLAYLEQNPDVKAALLAGGQPLEAGAKDHYEKHGVNEHRRLPMKPNAGVIPDWLAYLELYPDVKAYVVAQGQALEEGARLHYETYGRSEHRTLPRKPAATATPPDSQYFVYRSLVVEGMSN